MILRLLGWSIAGRYAHELPKVILAVAPHTSGWDIPIGMLVRSSLRMDANFVAKHTLFKPPFGWFFRWVGAIPVDRRQRNNFVLAVVDIFTQSEKLHLAIAPEGTRKRVERLRTGFYHISRLSNVPIQLVKLDWAQQVVTFGEIFQPTGNESADMQYIWDYFKGIPGYHPEDSII